MQTSVLIAACYDAACRPPTSGGTGGSSPAKVSISHIRGEIARERNAILKELDTQGVSKDNPLRHIFASRMANRVLVVRNEKNEVVGGVQYDLNKRDKTLDIRDMRMSQQRSGHGTEAFKSMAQIAKEENLEMTIYGAVESAKPFYAKQGAVFQTGSSIGHFTQAARDALAEGMPIPGHPNMPYEDWVQIDFACYTAECRPPTSGGTGGSSPKPGADGKTYLKSKGVMAILAANGKELTLTFSTENPPFDPDLGSDIDDIIWEAIGAQALQGLKKAYDAAPIKKTPHIVMGDFSTHEGFRLQARDSARRMGKPDQVADHIAENTWGFVYSKEDPQGRPLAIPVGAIGINASRRVLETVLQDGKPPGTMPSAQDVAQMTYVAAHEYGHHRYWQGPDKRPPWEAKVLYAEFQRHPDLSPYGRTNFKEAHAEAFADWVFRGTATEVTQAYQDSFGWGEKDAAQFAARIQEVPDVEDFEDEYGVLDTWDGPIPLRPLESENALQADGQVRKTASHRPVPPQDFDRIQLL